MKKKRIRYYYLANLGGYPVGMDFCGFDDEKQNTKEEAKAWYQSFKKDVCPITGLIKNTGYTMADIKITPVRKKLQFDTPTEGRDMIISLYQADAETTGGEFADYLANHISEEFESAMQLPLIMGALQAFRVWDYDGEDEVQCEVRMSYLNDLKIWDNEFQDYMYSDGSFIPEGIRIGIQEKENNEVSLDIGIFIASNARRSKDGHE